MKHSSRRLATVSLLMLLLALAAVSAATMAWISLADTARIRSMNMEVTTGISLRFDTEPHSEFPEYAQSLSEARLYESLRRTWGYDPASVPLTPVTSADGQRFYTQGGDEVSAASGAFQSYTLHFMSTQDMLVHLTSDDGEDAANGTLVASEREALPAALRISFTCGGVTRIYDPGATEQEQTSENKLFFSLPKAGEMVYNNTNCLFSLKANQDTPVRVCIWLEGTDEACTDEVKSSSYTIRLRLIGTDAEHNPL